MLCVTIAKSHSGGSPLWWLLILLLQREQCFSCVPFRWQGNWIRRGAKRPENPVTRFLRWQGNWIHRGAKRPENPVTRFPAGRRGPRSGEGVLEGKNRKETQSRAGRLSAVRIAAECHIGAWPRTPYGPSRGSEGGRREIFESYSSCTLPAGPLWWLRHHLSPRESVSRDFQVAVAPLQITFACHPYSGGTMGAGQWRQFMSMAMTAENHTTGLRPWKCTPFGAAHHFS